MKSAFSSLKLFGLRFQILLSSQSLCYITDISTYVLSQGGQIFTELSQIIIRL